MIFETFILVNAGAFTAYMPTVCPRMSARVFHFMIDGHAGTSLPLWLEMEMINAACAIVPEI